MIRVTGIRAAGYLNPEKERMNCTSQLTQPASLEIC
jgi:hypothetical protein